jgi:hypothetical protein
MHRGSDALPTYLRSVATPPRSEQPAVRGRFAVRVIDYTPPSARNGPRSTESVASAPASESIVWRVFHGRDTLALD